MIMMLVLNMMMKQVNFSVIVINYYYIIILLKGVFIMTIRDFILKTVDSYVDLKINAYQNNKLIQSFSAKKHTWNCADVPESLIDLDIVSIVPYYDCIVLEVNTPYYKPSQLDYWTYQITLSDGLYDNIVGDSGEMQFLNKKEAVQDAEHYISSELINQYNRPFEDFNIIPQPVYKN